MRQQITILIVLLVILAAAAIIDNLFYSRPHGHGDYLFLSVYWICGICISLVSANFIWTMAFAGRKGQRSDTMNRRLNRRDTFRIVYPPPVRPILVIQRIDGNVKRNLEFPILDLSQGGSCFMDDGSLGGMKDFSGHIRFRCGDRIDISGMLIRKTGRLISVQFYNAIDWAVLLDEQRRLLAPDNCGP